MMEPFVINNQWISLNEITSIIETNQKVILGENALEKIIKCHNYLNKRIEETDSLIYGVNTGFGSLCNTKISNTDLSKLQYNLIVSHACGTGDKVPFHLVKRMLLLKSIGLAHGNSGVQVETIQRLLFFYNNDIYPVIYQQGSLGASGDLAPLAHMSLPLIGEGQVSHNGELYSASEINKKFGLSPITLTAKEGLALLNGTQFMSAYASYICSKSKNFIEFGLKVAAMSIEGYDGRLNPFQANVNEIRNQVGQIEIAKQLRSFLEGSQIIDSEKEHVQDPYSFRCIPQVHGASLDALNYSSQIIENEINAVTDNPTIFPEENDVVSAGNFHGQPLALVMDFLAIAIAELGSISERRLYKLISGTRGLPPFLVKNSGLNSGFMIYQYTCASIVSQNKQLCTPASIDSIDSSNGQEDHVSMGANAATKLYRILENSITILSIELLAAAQAIDFRRPLKSSVILENIHSEFRKAVSFLEKDRYAAKDIQKSVEFVKTQINEKQ